VTATDFAARVECIAPIAVAEGFWDCGFIVRDLGGGDHYRVAYVSDGYWFQSVGSGEALAFGTDAPPAAAAGDKVTLDLIAVGPDAYFGVNGQFVSKLDFSALTNPGEISLGSSFFNDTYIGGGGVSFDDFVVWSLDGEQIAPSPTSDVADATPTDLAVSTPTDVAAPPSPTAGLPFETPTDTTTGMAGVTGNTYVSPQFGYGLTWTDEWTVESASSEEQGDHLGMTNGTVLVDLIGEAATPDGTCFDWLIDYYENQPNYSDVQWAVDNVSAVPGVWETTGIITVTYTAPTPTSIAAQPSPTAGIPFETPTSIPDNTTGNYINYVACSTLPDQGAVVTLEMFVPVSEFRAQEAAMEALRAGFTPTSGTQIAQPSPTAELGVPTGTPVGAVTDNTYTSPTYGYTLTWDPAVWEVVNEQTSGDGFDYLRLESDRLIAELYGAQGPDSAAQCLDNLIAYYEGQPEYSDVGYVRDAQTSELGDMATGVLEFIETNTLGQAVETFDDVTCIRMDDQNAIVFLEIYMSPLDYLPESGNREALKSGLTVPGGVAPDATPHVEAATTVPVEPTATGPAPTEAAGTDAASGFALLEPVGGSAVQGIGTLTAEARSVRFQMVVTGTQPGDVVAIYRGGCETVQPGQDPDYIVGELDAQGILQDEVRVRLSVLLTRDDYAVVVFGAADESFSAPLACGVIEERS
jgi:hypothetical protein